MIAASMRRIALLATATGVTGCWGASIGFRTVPPPRAEVVVVAPEPPPQERVVVVARPAPPPSETVVVASEPPARPGRRVFVRIAGVPSDYPDYVPFYLNGTVTMSAHTQQHGKQGYMLQLVTNDDPNAIIAFYKSQMGVAPNAEVNMGATRILEYAEDQKRNKFVVTVSSNGPQSVVMLFAETDNR